MLTKTRFSKLLRPSLALLSSSLALPLSASVVYVNNEERRMREETKLPCRRVKSQVCLLGSCFFIIFTSNAGSVSQC